MQGSRANRLLAACLLAAALVLAVRGLRVMPDSDLVSPWWWATALVTVVLILAPRRHARLVLAVGAAIAFCASLLADRGVVFGAGFAIASTVEAFVVLRWLSGFQVDQPQLRGWVDYRRWLLGIAVASSAAGVITAVTIGLTGGTDLWRPLLWITATHFGAQAVFLPLVMRQPRRRVRLSAVEILSHLALLTLGAFICFSADATEPAAFLLLPLLMWSAARFTPTWANIELLTVAMGMALLSGAQRGPFVEITDHSSALAIASSGQIFVVVSAVTSVAFSVAMGNLHDSLRRIRENEVQLGQLLDSASGTAFIATDLDGLITWFSPGAEQLLGYSGEQVVGRLTPAPFHESRELAARARELGVPAGYGVVTHAVAHGTEQDTRDWTYVRQDGSRLTVSLSVTAVRDDDGRPQSYLSVIRDVTDRRAAEQALVFALDKERETNRRMLELDKAKGEFVSTVSHELRTPLTSIVGYTELLADDLADDFSPEQQELVERIDRNADRLLHLVEDLLTLARMEDDSLRLDRVETDLRQAVQTATEEVAHAAHQARVALKVTVPDVPVLLQGDPDYLERLTLNLVGNAVKFTRAGGVVEVCVEVDGDVASLRVSDTGMGIPLDEQDRLFQRFFRSSLASEHAIQGTGLGLHIVQSIAEAHNGRVEFESVPGVGTTFVFFVPLLNAANVPGPAEPSRPQRTIS